MDHTCTVGIKSLLCAAGIALLAVSCSKKTEIEIDVEPARIKTKSIESEAKSKADVAAYNHELARTDWIFSIVPELSFSIKDEKKESNGYYIWIEITGVKLKLALPIVSYVSDKAPKYVLDHEQGHVKICRRVYANCREHAAKAVKGVLGKRFEGFGPDRKLALSSAIDAAAREIAVSYRTDVAGLAEKISSEYDQLCEKEDRQNRADQTVEDAFARVQAEEKKAKSAN